MIQPIVESSTQGRRERALRNIDPQDLLVPDDPRVPNVDALADVSIPTPHGGRSVTNKDKSNASPRELFAGDDNVDEVTDVGILHRHGQDGSEALNVHDLGILLPISGRGGVDPLGRGMDKDAVGGIGRALVEATPTTSPTSGEACESFVECDYGYAVVNGTVTYETTCDEACGNDCCTGDFSYDWFTGKVCRDETSCMGVDACLSATISHVINSCNGPSACDYAGLHYPIGGDITNSCNGNEACYQLSYYGTAGNIDSSCNGNEACKNGDITNVINSCNGPAMDLQPLSMWVSFMGLLETSQTRAMGITHALGCHITGQLETLTVREMDTKLAYMWHTKGQLEILPDRAMDIIVMVMLVITLGMRVVVYLFVLTLEVLALM